MAAADGARRGGRQVGAAGGSTSQDIWATNRRRATSAASNFWCWAAVNCPPKSSIAARSSIKTWLDQRGHLNRNRRILLANPKSSAVKAM